MTNSKRLWRYKALALNLVFLTSMQPVFVASTFGQNKADNLTAHLGIAQSELTAKKSPVPFEPNPVEADGNNSTIRPDVHGTMSVENFQGTQTNLSWTHDSADGFRNYLANWYQPNFARQDTGVSVWLYNDVSGGDNFDLWSSGGIDYGVDAVMAAWTSSHGGMSSNVFRASMGADWAGRGFTARSSNMRLGGNAGSFGDERNRYLFWDTCNSVMISGGNDPYTTWGTRANGVRMIFGYETVSVDSPNYGRFFWEEWNKGKSLSYSHLDASWRIRTRQSPAVVAFGATSSEAYARLDGERYLSWGAVSANWASWRWYYASSLIDNPLALPGQVNIHGVTAGGNSDAQVQAIARNIGIDASDASAIEQRKFDTKAVQTDAVTLIVEKDGDFELLLNKAAASKSDKNGLTNADFVAEAQNIVQQYNLTANQEYRVSMVRDLNEDSASQTEKGTARVVEKTVVLDQVINGLAFNDPDAGHLEITFDAQSGAVKRVRSTFRAVTESNQSASSALLSIEQARQAALNKFAEPPSPGVANNSSYQILPESESVGYQILDGKVTPVYRALIINSKYSDERPQEAVISLL